MMGFKKLEYSGVTWPLKLSLLYKHLMGTLNIRPNDIVDVADHCGLC